LVTPFRDGSVAFDDLERLLEFHLEAGTSGVMVCGTTGEGATLTGSEYRQIISFVTKKLRGKLPVIASIGSNNTYAAVENAKVARECGADGVLAITPYYNKPTQDGMIAHFKKIASSTDLPVIIYNIPGRTAVNLLPESMEKLSAIPNIVAVKESSGDMKQVLRIVRLCGERLFVLSGEDLMVLPILAVGGKGVISATANIVPKRMAEMCRLFFEGKVAEAARVQLDISPVIEACFIETNPGPMKAALSAMGLCSDELRLPLVTMRPENRKRLLETLREHHLI